MVTAVMTPEVTRVVKTSVMLLAFLGGSSCEHLDAA